MILANVGDSTMVPRRKQKSVYPTPVEAVVMTDDHKPDSIAERERIEGIGDQVLASKNGVMRVAWNGIPFLNIAHSLGDLWSYNPEHNSYHVSPIPDVTEYVLSSRDQFLIIASDGLWNVIRPQEAVDFIHSFREDEVGRGERREHSMVTDALLKECLRRWNLQAPWRADNISVMVVFLGEEKTKEIGCKSTGQDPREETGHQNRLHKKGGHHAQRHPTGKKNLC